MNKIIIRKKITLQIVFAIYLLLLVKLILFKSHVHITLTSISEYNFNPFSINLKPLKTIMIYLKGLPTQSIATRNLLGNIILFLPFGFFIPIIFPKFNSYKKALLISIAFSLSFEITQLTLGIGSFDIDDLILNTLGAIIGYSIIKKINFSISPLKTSNL